MVTTTVQEEIMELFTNLTAEEQREVLGFVKGILSTHEDEEVDEEFIEEYNREIDEAEAEIAAGNFYTQEEIEKELAEWKKR